MVGSAVYAGVYSQAQMDAVQDKDGITQGKRWRASAIAAR